MAADAVEFQSSIAVLLPLRQTHATINTLTYEMQEEAAKRSLAVRDGIERNARWMRLYFRHARTLKSSIAPISRSENGSARFVASAAYLALREVWRGPEQLPSGAHFAIRGGQLKFLTNRTG